MIAHFDLTTQLDDCGKSFSGIPQIPTAHSTINIDCHQFIIRSTLETLFTVPSTSLWFAKRERIHFLSPLTALMAPRKYYDLLEVAPNASEADLKKAYRKKSPHSS